MVATFVETFGLGEIGAPHDQLGWIWGEPGDTHSGGEPELSAAEPIAETQELVVGSSRQTDAEARISHEWGEGEGERSD